MLLAMMCIALVSSAPAPQDYDDLNSAASDHGKTINTVLYS